MEAFRMDSTPSGSRFRAAARGVLAEPTFLPLAMCAALGCSFLIARAYVSGHVGYVFLVKNLILAWIPYLLSVAAPTRRTRLGAAAVWLAWLAMFPNPPYIVTDLIHWRG